MWNDTETTRAALHPMLPRPSGSRRQARPLHWRITKFEAVWNARLPCEEIQQRGILLQSYVVLRLQSAFKAPESIHWSWTRLPSECTRPRVTDGGLHFSIYQAHDGTLHASGAAQNVRYEDLLGSPRKQRRLCHPPSTTQRRLSHRDASVMESRTQHFSMRSLLLQSTRHSVRYVACGVSHGVILTRASSGELELFTWGVGEYGQLGLGEDVHCATTLTPITTSGELLTTLKRVTDIETSIFVRCGPLSTCVAVVDDSSTALWTWGRVPTTPASTQQWTPRCDLVAPCPMRARDIQLGLNHIVLLSDAGQVFTWGHNDNGQLGTGQATSSGGWHHVEFHHAIVAIDAIACGYDHTLALSRRSSTVFAWGSNRVGACGATTKFFEYYQPVAIKPLGTSVVTAIGSKGHTSLAVTESGRLVVWGATGSETAYLVPTDAGDLPTAPRAIVGYGSVHCLTGDGGSADRFIAQSVHESISPAAASAASQPDVASFVRVIGVSVCSGLIPQRLHDLRWLRPSTHRIRVFTSDAVAVLVTLSSPISTIAINLQSMTSSGDSISSPIECVPLHPSLSLVVLKPIESTGSFEVTWQPPIALESLTLLSVTRCVPPTRRHAMLRVRSLGLRQWIATTDRMDFTEFMHLVNGHSDELCQAIACSPLAVASAEDTLAALSWDVDRCVVERAMLLNWSAATSQQWPSAFALWSGVLENDAENDGSDVLTQLATIEAAPTEGPSLLDLLESSGEESGLPLETLYVSVAHRLISGDTPCEVSSIQRETFTMELGSFTPVSTEHPPSVRLNGPSDVHVPQSALEYLVTGSGASQQQQNPMDTTDVYAWTSDLGDAFFSTVSSPQPTRSGQVHVYLSDFESTPLRRLQRNVHEALWQIMNSHRLSMRQLHTRLAPLNDAAVLRARLPMLDAYSDCDELWFSLFATLCGQQIATRKSLSLQALRLFLVDPFHDSFWNGYLADWQESLARRSVRQIHKELAEAFGGHTVHHSHTQISMDWESFLAGLQRLHKRLQWVLSPQDACRLLYRFDSGRCDGQAIAVHRFFQILVANASKGVDVIPRQERMERARPSARPPSLDAFATPQALQKLYRSRAEEPPRRAEPRRTNRTSARDTDDGLTAIADLQRVGNSRLARIRNLPVSRILSEGIHFRSLPTRARQRYAVTTDDEEES